MLEGSGFRLRSFDKSRRELLLRRESGGWLREVSVPLFDPGLLELLDYDSETMLRLRGDPVLDKKLGMADKDSLDSCYLVALSTRGSPKILRFRVPIKKKLEFFDVSFVEDSRQALARTPRLDPPFMADFRRLDREGTGAALREWAGALGINPETHGNILRLAQELEKEEYREWLDGMEGFFNAAVPFPGGRRQLGGRSEILV